MSQGRDGARVRAAVEDGLEHGPGIGCYGGRRAIPGQVFIQRECELPATGSRTNTGLAGRNRQAGEHLRTATCTTPPAPDPILQCTGLTSAARAKRLPSSVISWMGARSFISRTLHRVLRYCGSSRGSRARALPRPAAIRRWSSTTRRLVPAGNKAWSSCTAGESCNDQRSVPEWRSGHHFLAVLRFTSAHTPIRFLWATTNGKLHQFTECSMGLPRSHHKLASVGGANALTSPVL